MRCEDARPLISAGLDGELDEICGAHLRTHLAECVPCSTEREMLTATVQLLRDLPETEPPAALRRRIGVALLEAERASQRRRLGLASLVWPHAPGWAWGAVLGAAVAAVALLTPHPQPLNRRVASLPNPPHVVAPVRPSLPPAEAPALHPPQRVIAVRKQSLASQPRLVLPSPPDRLTATLPPRGTPDAAVPIYSGPAARPAPGHRHRLRSHSAHRLIVADRHAGPSLPAPLTTPRGAQAPSPLPPDRSMRSADDSTRLAQTGKPSPADPITPQLPDPDSEMDTAGMTQMASGSGMPAAQETEDDDLAELRQRLIDRPLPVPELGQLKPANASHTNRDGWIRF
jgi:putative zinc finger protein